LGGSLHKSACKFVGERQRRRKPKSKSKRFQKECWCITLRKKKRSEGEGGGTNPAKGTGNRRSHNPKKLQLLAKEKLCMLAPLQGRPNTAIREVAL